jgi:predicted DNA-binding transcriptional regulator AlpA
MEIDIHSSDFRLWNINEVADRLGVSAKLIEKMRKAGTFVEAIPIGRCVRWDPADIRAYVHGLKETAVSDEAAAEGAVAA